MEICKNVIRVCFKAVYKFLCELFKKGIVPFTFVNTVLHSIIQSSDGIDGLKHLLIEAIVLEEKFNELTKHECLIDGILNDETIILKNYPFKEEKYSAFKTKCDNHSKELKHIVLSLYATISHISEDQLPSEYLWCQEFF